MVLKELYKYIKALIVSWLICLALIFFKLFIPWEQLQDISIFSILISDTMVSWRISRLNLLRSTSTAADKVLMMMGSATGYFLSNCKEIVICIAAYYYVIPHLVGKVQSHFAVITMILTILCYIVVPEWLDRVLRWINGRRTGSGHDYDEEDDEMPELEDCSSLESWELSTVYERNVGQISKIITEPADDECEMTVGEGGDSSEEDKYIFDPVFGAIPENIKRLWDSSSYTAMSSSMDSMNEGSSSGGYMSNRSTSFSRSPRQPAKPLPPVRFSQDNLADLDR